MTGAEFKGALRRLGRTQIGFAQEIGVSRRTVHLWVERGPPAYAIHLLDLIERCGMLPVQGRPVKQSCSDLASVLGDMYARASSEGAGPDFVRAVERWLEIHRDIR
ncbi:hypothetical protein [Methylobacterium sp. C1]|uniref:helix-turn-helix domain-containing protein n=1 Tax=Methylobacterium sp. C1 TaxID=1479019 RepID=UPI0008D90CC4|nr:hypothetical protein [Methylobacterium sp. C1]